MIDRNPSFIGLGVEKAATSWIFTCLREHPDVCMPIKEINFFSTDDLWANGQSWYTQIFRKRCNDYHFTGEYSTEYFHNAKAIERIHSLFPDIKLIVCLRDPITRAYSNYQNDIMSGRMDKRMIFEDALNYNNGYLDKGHYRDHLDRVFAYFDRSQLHIALYEDIKIDPASFIQMIYDFLEVDSSYTPDSLLKIINRSRKPRLALLEKGMNVLAHRLSNNSLTNALWWKLRQSYLPSKIRKWNTRSSKEVYKIEPAVYAQLVDHFKEHKSYMEQLLGRSLNWLNEKEV